MTRPTVGTGKSWTINEEARADENTSEDWRMENCVVRLVAGVVVVTVNATATPERRWRRAKAVTLVMTTADGSTPSVMLTAFVNACCAWVVNVATVYPERVTCSATGELLMTGLGGGGGGGGVVHNDVPQKLTAEQLGKINAVGFVER